MDDGGEPKICLKLKGKKAVGSLETFGFFFLRLTIPEYFTFNPTDYALH